MTKFKPRLFISLLLTGLVVSVTAGYYSVPVKTNVAGVLSPEERAALHSVHAEKQEELHSSHTRAVFQKRLKYTEIRDVYLPLETYLDEYIEMWGDRYYTVPQKMRDYFQPVPFGEDMTLTERLSVYLRISPDEQQDVEMAVEPALRSLLAEELNNVTVQESTPKKVILVIKPFQEKGREIKERLHQEITRILGHNRAHFLLTSRDWDSRFLSFGRKKRIYEVYWSEDNKSWEMTGPFGWCSGIPSSEAGRFYQYLPEEVKEFVHPEDIHHPPNANTRGTK